MPKYLIFKNDDLWDASFDSLTPHIKKIVNDKIMNDIALDPRKNEELHFELDSLWSFNRMKNGTRIIYAICGDCRKKGLNMLNNCKSCSEMHNDTIMLWMVGPHDIYQALSRMRRQAWIDYNKKQKAE